MNDALQQGAGLENCWLSDDPLALTAIFQPQINLAVWDRPEPPLQPYLQSLMALPGGLALKAWGTPETLLQSIERDLPAGPDRQVLVDDLWLLLDMYACLFDLDELGIRINLLRQAMCPRFHVDRVQARLVCSYGGAGTEWLPNSQVARAALGVVGRSEQIACGPAQQLVAGQVALLKGEQWQDNAGLGIVHRSPALSADSARLLVTLDM